MEIKLKRVYEVEESDENRILVDRLWPRGKTKESLHLLAWAKEVAPTKELRNKFHKGEISFSEFEKEYVEELERNPALPSFTEKIKEKSVTFLYGSKNKEENHAKVLKDFLDSRYNP